MYVCASIFTELGRDIHQAIQAAVAKAEPAPHQMAVNLTVKMAAVCREFRRWGAVPPPYPRRTHRIPSLFDSAKNLAALVNEP